MVSQEREIERNMYDKKKNAQGTKEKSNNNSLILVLLLFIFIITIVFILLQYIFPSYIVIKWTLNVHHRHVTI